MTLIALLSDFGTHDPYAAAMKGVIVTRCDAPVIDLSHEIEPFDVFGGAYFLRSIMPSFRGGAQAVIFVCVVDPGVGSDRRILAVRQEGHTILAPDNGLLSLVIRDDALVRAVENESLFLTGGSSTFHGRDRFAPVAAALARGFALDELGPAVPVDEILKLDYTGPHLDGDVWRGTIVAIDRFGSAISDLDASLAGQEGCLEVRIGPHRISRVAANYADAGDELFVIAGSAGTLEISLKNGSAADVLHIVRFDQVEARVVPTPDD